MNDELLNKIKDKIVTSYQPEKIYLFGSYARGKINADSDIDLLIIMNSDLPRYVCASKILLTLKNFSIPFDILVYSPDEIKYWNGTTNHIITEVLKTGVILYDRES